MKAIFLDIAREELEEAVAFYDTRRTGLGDEFIEEVERTVQRILTRPKSWAPLSAHTRGCRTRRFPYQVVYQIRDREVLIVAIMHQRRRPGYWKGRVVHEVAEGTNKA